MIFTPYNNGISNPKGKAGKLTAFLKNNLNLTPMRKSDINAMPEYFDRYINLTDDVSLNIALKTSLEELENFPIEQWKALGEKTYATGKWTAKDMLQHLIDTERIFTYRMLAFSRNEPQRMLSYDEGLYARNAGANLRTIEDLLAELILVRKSFMAMYHSFSPEMLLKMGRGFTGQYSVLSMGFMIPGHQRWHFRVIEQKYLPLLLAEKPNT
jgi:hypothetical protein